MSASWRTARGVSPSPQVFSRGEVLLLHHHDVPAGLGQPVAARRAGGARTDHHHVVDRAPPRAGSGAAVAAPLGRRAGVAFVAAVLAAGPSWREPSWPRAFFAGALADAAFMWPGVRPSPGRLARAGRRLGRRSGRQPWPRSLRAAAAAFFGGAGRGGVVGSRHEGIVGPPAGPLTSDADVPGERGHMVETDHRGPVPPDPDSGAARLRLHRVLAGVLGHAGAEEEADGGQARALRVRHRARTSSRRSGSRSASTWCR